MGWFVYHIFVVCENCGFKNDLSVKKGITVKQFVESRECRCHECGCKIKPKEYRTDWLK